MRYFLVSEDDSALTGLRLAGVEGQKAVTAAEAEKAVMTAAAAADIAVVLITPKIREMIPETVEKLQLGAKKPLVAVIPASKGDFTGADAMNDAVRQAIGVKL